MDVLVKVGVVVQVVVAVLGAVCLLGGDTLERLGLISGVDPSLSGELPRAAQRATDDETDERRRPVVEEAASPRASSDAALVELLFASAVARRGVDGAEVERRVAAIEARRERTNQVKRDQEELQIDEVLEGFESLMRHHPESGAKAREILDEYIDLRYRTYGPMQIVDPGFAAGQREALRQRVGDRLLAELPPAQGVTVLKRLFI